MCSMCGRITQQQPMSELARIFDAEPVAPEPGPAYNVAPTDDLTVVVQAPEGRRGVTRYRWGLIPGWATDEKVGSRAFNARAETVAEKAAFRTGFRGRRCLVPADGFYEWRRTADGRQPWLIRRRDGEPLALAGLWASWHNPALPPEAPPVRSATIVTTAPNELMRQLHDRMPVILAPEIWSTWLDPRFGDLGLLRDLLVPSVPDELEAVPVSTLVNSVRETGPSLVSPIGDPLRVDRSLREGR